MRKIKEGSAEIFIPTEAKISKNLPVFYNPIMKLNRDITILLLQQFPPMHLCDPLAGTGIRAIRFAKELKYKSIAANDNNERAVALMRKNAKHNKVKFEIYNKDANLMVLESKGFDFIDLDVFGSPNFMLDSSVKRLARHGILAVTATDTGALAGSFPNACKRKYWATPLRNEFMHETGIRILIRKVQLVAMQYDKALIPIFSHATDHYSRVYFHVEKSKSYVDKILAKYGYLLWCSNCLNRAVSKHNAAKCSCGNEFTTAGPLWLGPLWNHKVVKQMLPFAEERAEELLQVIHKESHIPIVGFYDIHRICKTLKTTVPKTELIIKELKKKTFKVSKTHFSEYGLRTDAPIDEIKKILKKL